MSNARDELIRIDAHGVAHPIGVVAGQRMRPHEGTYRILPSPRHVVLMRHTGEDGVVDEGDGAVVRLAGEIASVGVICDIFSLIAQTGWRGVLSVHSGETLRKIYLSQGSVVGVKSNIEDERLGRVMYRYGHINEDDLAAVEAHMIPGKRFGVLSMEMGILTSEAIYKAFAQQITDVVVGAMRVEDGTYFFLDGFEEAELSSPQSLSVNSLLMDGVTRLDEVRYFEEKVPSLDHVPARAHRTDAPTAEVTDVYERVDGETSVRDLGRITGLGEFETLKKVYSLVQSKHVVMRPPQMSGGPVSIVAAANDVMTSVFRAAKGAGKGEELRQALAHFTVGAGIYFELLFQGAGPDEQGKLNPERVVSNAPMISDGSDVEQSLRKVLFDYVSFALFSVGASIGKEGEAHLLSECEQALGALRPEAR